LRSLLITAIFFLSFPAFGDITGIPRVVDGDTIHIGKLKIRLWGYDSPEQKQTCAVKGKSWNCGLAATKHLKEFIGDNPVSCVQKDKDRYGRIVAKCAVGTLDIGAEMVEVGLAIPYWKYSGKYYIQSYKEAKGLGRGIHAGTFVEPWVWRKRKK
jgi:endonuclease YncB( thermonuclease family)